MQSKTNHEIERRHLLRLGAAIASGVVASSGFVACSRENASQTANPLHTFVQPPVIESINGLLEVTLVASYLDTKLSMDGSDRQFPVSLRAYAHDDRGPGCSGPTLIVKGGDQLRIKLVNDLPVNPPVAAFRDPSNYLSPNTTNLHTHGLHVDPKVRSDRTPFEYGDFVVDPSGRGVQPRGNSRQYVYDIPKGHPEGPYYYHPQYHGSSAIQTASLMAGVIMVRGPADDLPEMAQADELIFLFQAPYFATGAIENNHGADPGSLEKFSQIAGNPSGHGVRGPNSDYLDSQPVLINGVRRPTIVMHSGEVQRWRFINSQVFNHLNLSLDFHTLHEYTTDGWGRTAYREHPDGLRSARDGVVLGPGNRSSVLVKAGESGTYILRSLPCKVSQGKTAAILPGDILAYVAVVETRKFMNFPPVPLPVSRFLDPITDQELASSGGRKRSIMFNLIGNELRSGSGNPRSVASDRIDPVANIASGIKELLTLNVARLGTGMSRVSGKAVEESQDVPTSIVRSPEYHLQPANVIVQNIVLGSVEEWTVFNFNDIVHTLHVHVNPMYITRVNGVSVEPYWCDTVSLPPGGTPEMPTSVTFRMRFIDFTGDYILHSQKLQYSDLGMVQRITVVPAWTLHKAQERVESRHREAGGGKFEPGLTQSAFLNSSTENALEAKPCDGGGGNSLFEGFR